MFLALKSTQKIFLIRLLYYAVLISFSDICFCASYGDNRRENISGKTKVVTNKISVKHYTIWSQKLEIEGKFNKNTNSFRFVGYKFFFLRGGHYITNYDVVWVMKLIHFMSFQELLDGYCLLRLGWVWSEASSFANKCLNCTLWISHTSSNISRAQLCHSGCGVPFMKPEIILCRYHRLSSCFCCFSCIAHVKSM